MNDEWCYIISVSLHLPLFDPTRSLLMCVHTVIINLNCIHWIVDSYYLRCCAVVKQLRVWLPWLCELDIG